MQHELAVDDISSGVSIEDLTAFDAGRAMRIRRHINAARSIKRDKALSFGSCQSMSRKAGQVAGVCNEFVIINWV